MLINLFTYIKNSMPDGLQRAGAIEFVRALLLQLSAVSERFQLFVPDLRYRIHVDASVVSLRHHIRRELEIDVTITELDGKPMDFLVEVDGFVDENRLRALLDNAKLAGKSYTFRIGAIEYIARFIGHRCEDIGEDYQAKFIDHRCEDDGAVRIDVVVEAQTDDYRIILTASRAVRSNVEVEVNVYDTTGAPLPGIFYVTIPTGQITASENVDFSGLVLDGSLLRTKSRLQQPHGGSDEYFKYTVHDVHPKY